MRRANHIDVCGMPEAFAPKKFELVNSCERRTPTEEYSILKAIDKE